MNINSDHGMRLYLYANKGAAWISCKIPNERIFTNNQQGIGEMIFKPDQNDFRAI
jgi:hypothetical protein